MYSVGNGHYYARNGNELHKLPPDTAPAAHTMLAPPTPTSPSFSSTNHLLAAPEPGQLDSRLSQLVAQKLLEGCTLLSESCEVTSVPLVQDQQGRIISVGTGKVYERISGKLREMGAFTPTASRDMHTMSSMPSSANPSDSQPLAALASSSFAIHPPTSAPSFATTPTSSLAASSFPAPMFSPLSMPPPPLTAAPLHEMARTIDGTLSVLGQQLDGVRGALATASGTEAVAPLVSLVKEIALAIAALRAL